MQTRTGGGPGLGQSVGQGARIDVSVPLVAHVIFRLDIGGLENGLVNLINRIPPDRYRHAIVCIDSFTDFRRRIDRDDVEVIAIGKRPGTDFPAKRRLYKAFRRLKPDIVHTRNLAALEALLPALLARVKRRIHGEHGWNTDDLHGSNPRLRLLRKMHSPLVSEYVALSLEIRDYLIRSVGVSPRKVRHIYNGVDLDRFHPSATRYANRGELNPLFRDDSILVGTIGRVHPVKDQMNLAAAFIRCLERAPDLASRARLVIVGDGELLSDVRDRLDDAGMAHLCWLPGRRDDIPAILQCLDVFVLPSLAEGISNTILEAMASGLPVIATNTGGNSELVVDGETGRLVPVGCEDALADAIESYIRDGGQRNSQGVAGRSRAERVFGMDAMVQNYARLYDENLPSGM